MKTQFILIALATALAMFVAMMLALEVGWRFGRARRAKGEGGAPKGSGLVEGLVFSLAGLLIAFTFSGAGARFEVRRQLIGEESNAIGTAYLRVDLLPADAQPEVRALFRRYVAERIAVFRDTDDLDRMAAAREKADATGREIWARSLAALQRPDATPRAGMLIPPSLNAMIDIATTRRVATESHPPMAIFSLLVVLGLFSSLLVGHAMSESGTRSRFYMVVLAFVMALCLYVTLDLEFPRMGLIRIDSADQVLIDLGRSMQP